MGTALSAAFQSSSDAGEAGLVGSTNACSPGSVSGPQTKHSSDLLFCVLQWPVQLLQTGPPGNVTVSTSFLTEGTVQVRWASADPWGTLRLAFSSLGH